LKFTAEEKTSKTPEMDSVNTLLLLKAVLSEEFLLKSLRCGLNKHDIICITENNTLNAKYRVFFRRIFGDYAPRITTATLEEYNQNIRSTIFGTEHKNDFVFNPDLSVVIKEPFDKKFKLEKFAFENSIIRLIDITNQIDEEIVETLYPAIAKIIESANIIMELVKSRKLNSQKDIISKYRELTDGNLKSENDDLDRILKFHYDYIPELTFLEF